MSEGEKPAASSGRRSLAERVSDLEQVFDLRKLVGRGETRSDIISYYNQSFLGYDLLHSREGAIHMALNPDGEFDERGYDRPVELILEQAPMRANSIVLELGCGKGYNLAAVARNEPTSTVIGIDLVPRHVRRAVRNTRRYPGATAHLGNFQSMAFEDSSIDLAYSIESFCHTTDLEGALREVRRVTREFGIFIVIDAWRTDSSPLLPPEYLRAARILETAMSVGTAPTRGQWLEAAFRQGWRIVELRSLSHEAMPNLERFESWSTRFLGRPGLARILRRIGPSKLWQNAIAGYLMAESVREGVHTYDMICLRAGD